MSRYEAGPSQGSSRTFTVVLLSLLILAVIGALFGFVIGQRDIDENKSAAGDGQSAGAHGVTSASTPGPASRKPPVLPQGTPCPPFIGQAAKTMDGNTSLPLLLVQYIRTTKGHEVWICQETGKPDLWYQGHDRKQDYYDGGEVPQEGVNGLLRPGVKSTGYRTWTLVNEGTTYTVTPGSLKVTGNQTLTDTAFQANPPAER